MPFCLQCQKHINRDTHYSLDIGCMNLGKTGWSAGTDRNYSGVREVVLVGEELPEGYRWQVDGSKMRVVEDKRV